MHNVLALVDCYPRQAVELADEDGEGQVMVANEVSENDVIASYHFVINATCNLFYFTCTRTQ